MRKNFSLLILSLSLSSIVSAKEPVIATLVNIISNEIQDYKIGNYKFRCPPYGVYTLEELLRNSKPDSVCRSSIQQFYKKEQALRNYAHKKLYVQQSYSILFKDEKCIVNVAGTKTYSEFLLDLGLGVKVPSKLDERYDSYFLKAQSKAKNAKRGLWSVGIAKKCATSITK